jgi:hypothetical protein
MHGVVQESVNVARLLPVLIDLAVNRIKIHGFLLQDCEEAHPVHRLGICARHIKVEIFLYQTPLGRDILYVQLPACVYKLQHLRICVLLDIRGSSRLYSIYQVALHFQDAAAYSHIWHLGLRQARHLPCPTAVCGLEGHGPLLLSEDWHPR